MPASRTRHATTAALGDQGQNDRKGGKGRWGVARCGTLGHLWRRRRRVPGTAQRPGGAVSDWMHGDARDLQRLPAMACGLYRTGLALDGEAPVAGQRLVYLHDHRPDEWPTVHLPTELELGRWEFGDGIEVLNAAFLMALEPLPPEGWYVLQQAVVATAEDAAELPARSLVALSYNRSGEAILTPAQFGAREVRFAEAGLRFEGADLFDHLDPVNFEVPEDAARRVLH